MVSHQPEWLIRTHQMMPEHFHGPDSGQHLPLVRTVVGFMLVQRTADRRTHVLIAIVIQLTQNRCDAPIGEVGVKNQLLAVIDAPQDNIRA